MNFSHEKPLKRFVNVPNSVNDKNLRGFCKLKEKKY